MAHFDFTPPPEDDDGGCVPVAIACALFTIGVAGAVVSLWTGGNAVTWVGSAVLMAAGAFLFIRATR